MELILLECEERMEKAINTFEDGLTSIRTGVANASLLNGIHIDYYGSATPLNQLSSITVQEGRSLVIKPYDSSCLKEIEKAINASHLGLPPQNDGVTIRLNIPPLTEETRRDLCKKIRKMEEEAKIQVRNVRRDMNDQAKKDEELTEDLEKLCLEKIQKITDENIKKIENIADNKEKEVMKV